MTDLTDLAQLSGKLIDKLEDLYGADVEMRIATIIVEVDAGEAEDGTDLVRFWTDDRSWVQEKFLEVVLDQMEDEKERRRQQSIDSDD